MTAFGYSSANVRFIGPEIETVVYVPYIYNDMAYCKMWIRPA